MRVVTGSGSGRRAVLLVASLAFMLLPLVARASNWGSSATGSNNLCTSWNDANFQNSQCSPTNQYQFVYISGAIPSALRTALTNSVDNDYNPITDISAVVDTSLTTYTDVAISRIQRSTSRSAHAVTLPRSA